MGKNTNIKAEALKVKGNELVAQKDWSAAAKKYKKAASLDPSCAAYYSNLSFCYEKMRCLGEYKGAAMKCVEVDPSFIKGYIRLANAHHQLWEYEEETKVLEQGLVLDNQNSELRRMLNEVEAKISYREKFEVFVVGVDEEGGNSPTLFGGMPHDELESLLGSCLNTKDSAFFGLKRSTLPPSSKKYLDVSMYREEVRPVIHSFYNGPLKIKWLCEDDSIIVEGYVSGDDVPVVIMSGRGTRDVCQFLTGYETSQNIHYDNCLTIEQKCNLHIVLMQRFLREKGYELMGSPGFEDVMYVLFNGMSKICQKYAMFKDSVDFRLIYADISIGRQHTGFDLGSCTYDIAIGKLAEDLEAAKRYDEAAALYVELCRGETLFRDAPTTLTKADLHCYAGLAYKSGRNYIESESEYVAVLRSEGTGWQWVDPPVQTDFREDALIGNPHFPSHTLNNMMRMYDTLHNEVMRGLQTSEAHMKMQKACFVLIALLKVAKNDVFGAKNMIRDHGEWLSGALKPKYRTKKKAFKAIVYATSSSSIEEYHKRLFDCWQAKTEVTMSHHSNGGFGSKEELQEEYLKKEKERSKDIAREVAKGGNLDAAQELTGGNTGCSGCSSWTSDKNLFKRCPCQTVSYCSKECQKKHWSIHKLSCPNRTRKKK